MINQRQIEETLKTIEEGNALVKTLCSPVGDDQSWDELLPKLSRTQKEVTATTLLPADGKMNLFKPANPQLQIMVGLLFNLKKCDVKYVFQSNANSKRWLNENESPVPKQMSLVQLKDFIKEARSQDIVLNNNEVLAGISLEDLIGVFAVEDMLLGRLNALSKQDLIQKKLNKLLPVFVITPQEGVRIYDNNQQQLDIQHALSLNPNDPAQVLARNLHRQVEEPASQPDQTLTVEDAIDMITHERQPVPSIERAIVYLNRYQPAALNKVFADYLFDNQHVNENIVSAFLTHCHAMTIVLHEKTVAFYEDDEPWEPSATIDEIIANWSPLVSAILFRNSTINKLIIQHYPQQIKNIMSALHELQRISVKFPRICFCPQEQITEAMSAFLLLLKQSDHLHYSFNFEDKRLAEIHLINQIDSLDTKDAVYAFYQQHTNDLCLHQHRHAIYDHLNDKSISKSREAFILALQRKLTQLPVDPQSIADTTPSTKKDDLRSWLQNKRRDLLQQQNSYRHFLLYSLSRTQAKIQALNIALGELNDISGSSALALFMENLMLNKALCERRTMGIAASNTYLALSRQLAM